MKAAYPSFQKLQWSELHAPGKLVGSVKLSHGTGVRRRNDAAASRTSERERRFANNGIEVRRRGRPKPNHARRSLPGFSVREAIVSRHTIPTQFSPPSRPRG